MLDGDRRVEQRLEILPHIDFFSLRLMKIEIGVFFAGASLAMSVGLASGTGTLSSGAASALAPGATASAFGSAAGDAATGAAGFASVAAPVPAFGMSALAGSDFGLSVATTVSALTRRPSAAGGTATVASAGVASISLPASTLCAVCPGCGDAGVAATGAGGLSLCTNRCGSANSAGFSSPRATITRAPKPREAVQPHRKIVRHADAAMRCPMADIFALMQRDARPGDALHEGHRRIAVDIGAVEDLFLDDAEDAQRGRQAGHAGGDRGVRDVRAVAVEMQLLLIDGNEDLQRTLRNIAERFLADVFGFFMRGLISGLRAPPPARSQRQNDCK